MTENAAGGPGGRSGGNLQRWILGGLAAGLLLGLIAHLLTGESGPLPGAREALETAVTQVIQPIGGIFLRLLFMTVVPLVFSSLALGVQEFGDVRKLGKVGLKTLLFTLFLSSVSVVIGLLLVNAIEPGKRMDPTARDALLAGGKDDATRIVRTAEESSGRPVLERIVTAVIPRNPVEAAARAFEGDILALMCFALLLGVALGALRSVRTAPVVAVLEGIFDASIWLVGLALRLAPVGVAALVFSLSARLGLEIFEVLGAYVITVLLGLAIQQFAVYPILLKTVCGWSPVDFFRRIRPVMITAFSTSSSNATLPTTLEVARTGLRIPARIGNFVLTLGSTFNQNGTALFEGVTVIFLAQCYGVELGLDKQLQVVGMSIAAGIGTAGVPGGSLPLVVLVLVSVGVPGEAIGIIIGVDRLLDMCRTVLNVTGDMVAAAFVARGEPEEAAEVETPG
jgi:DAACS family dicarboxylate/amino acid:cation (Na+ or H+) symporter